MKKDILEAFGKLGFKLEASENETWYSFKYEGLNYLYMCNCDDDDFLSIALPGIVDEDDAGDLSLPGLIEEINSTLKYVKSYMLGRAVWLFYERELFDGDDLEKIIGRMILRLEGGIRFARGKMDEMRKSSGRGDGAGDGKENDDDDGN